MNIVSVYFWIIVGKLSAIISDVPELAAGLWSSISAWSVHVAALIATCAVHVYTFLATCVSHAAAGLMALTSVIQHLGLNTAAYYQVRQRYCKMARLLILHFIYFRRTRGIPD